MSEMLVDDPTVDVAVAAMKLVPVFVLGSKGRSGTGLLSELLRAHPACTAPPEPLTREDWLLLFSDKLVSYVANISARRGSARFEPRDISGFDDAMLRALGRGLMTYLGQANDGATHLALKSPTIHGLDNGLRLFPNAKILVIIRNGRDSVESSLRSWPTEKDGSEITFEEFTRRWTQGAMSMLELMESHRGQFMSVRYEDLVLDLDRTLRRILRFTGLDAESYDFQMAANAPVVGSSSFGHVNGKLTWEPQEKTSEFDPLTRAADWSADQHRRFNAIAGPMMRAFGYPLIESFN